jgi:hypothetical protein
MAERNHLSAPAKPAPGEASDTRSADDIRQDIAARRDSITETVDHLSDRFHRTFDWRTYVATYPLVAVGVVAGAGFLLAGMFKRRATPTERMVEALADTLNDVTDRFRAQLDNVGLQRSSAWSRTVKAAATGAATKAITDYLRNRLVEQGVLHPASDAYAAHPQSPYAVEQEGDYAVHH